ncbi:MAG: DUF4340 domain-containing protein [Nitrospirales bacterium]|nr:DUF4340 domain-containing protein [Nitrospirales bacterium]
MLNPIRISVILGLVVLGLGSYILFIDIPQSRQIEQRVKQDRQILPFDDRAVTRLTWASKSETIELTRDDKFRWSIIHPIHSPADNQEIRRILRALTIGKIKRTIEGEDGASLDFSAYGLDPPYLTLTLSTPSESIEFALGDRGPFAPSLYMQTKPDNQVVLTTLDVMTFAHKTLTNFRLKDLLLFDREQVQEIRIQNKYGVMVLQRVAGVHSLTPNWTFLSPTPGPADKTAITTLLMELGDLRATGFVDLDQEKSAIRRHPPKSHVGITLTEGSLIHHLDIFHYGDAEKAFAVRTSKDPLFEIPTTILGPLTRDPFYFQNKRLFGLEVADLAMLSVQTADEHYVFIHQHDEWVLEDNPSVPLDQNVVNLFISRVVDLPAEIYLPQADAVESHILSPTVIIRGVNRQGEERGKLVLGKREKGLVLAEGAGLKGLYQVRSTILDQLPTKASLLQSQ